MPESGLRCDLLKVESIAKSGRVESLALRFNRDTACKLPRCNRLRAAGYFCAVVENYLVSPKGTNFINL